MAFRRYSAKSILTFSRNLSNKAINVRTLKHIGPGGFALLAVPITTFCLGTWQVKRRTWKLNLIDEVSKKGLEPPVNFPEDPEELSKMEYQKVKVRGRFDHSKELYIGPRQLFKADVEGGGLISSQARSGYHVITPFHLSDRNMTILVNRGWVPKKNMNPATRAEAQVSDEIELTGAVRLPESRPQFSPKMQPSSHLFLYRDVPRMAQMTGSEPIFLDACEDSTIPGGPVGGQTRVTFRNDHLSYLLTWYSLSAATTYMWYKKYMKGIKILV